VPSLRRLRANFRRAIATAVAAGPALGGCGSEPGIEGDADFVPVPCEGDQPQWLGDLQPEPAVDFLELVGDVRQQEGEACQGASDMAACRAVLAALPAAIGQQSFRLFTGVDHFKTGRLHATRGDAVIDIASGAALTSFLGSTNTPLEAMLLTQAAGYNVLCDNGGARPSDAGFEVQAFLGVGCGGRDRYLLAVTRDGSVTVLDRTRIKDPIKNCEVGRRPAGLHEPARRPCRSPGEYLARAASLEAASVAAFRHLARELKAHGAAAHLVAAARAAARDQVRHARSTARLATRLGATPERPQITATPVRDLESIALENAREGCVRETFGALEGQWQSLHAADLELRRAYRRIAEDELRHAALAWSVARWIEPRLSRAGQERVRAARADSLRALRCEQSVESSAEIRRVCGVPSRVQALALLDSVAPALA
jgi:hypothetical protein